MDKETEKRLACAEYAEAKRNPSEYDSDVEYDRDDYGE